MEKFEDLIDNLIEEDMPHVYATFVIDESGSMMNIAKEIVGGFDTQVDLMIEQEKTMDVVISVITFSDFPKIVFNRVSPTKAKGLLINNYRPYGMTALNDAIGLAISEYDNIDDEKAVFLMIIMTDGLENASQKYSTKDIKNKIDSLTDTGRWTFTYLGDNQNVQTISEDYGFNAGNVRGFSSSAAGTTQAYSVMSCSNSRYFDELKRGSRQVTNFYEEK